MRKKTNEEYKNELILVQPDVEVLEEYIDANTPIKHKCKIHNKIYPQRPSGALLGLCGCDDCKKNKIGDANRKTNEKFIKEVADIWGNEIIPLEVYKNSRKRMKFLHNTEAPHNFTSLPTYMSSGLQGCPVCAGRQICIGYNDIATTNPYIASLFLNEEDAHKYTQYSDQKTDFKCDCCGKPIGKRKISQVTKNNGVRCINCKDGISYPNKFIYNCLKQIEGQLQYLDREVTFDWCEFDFRNYKKHGIYDIYFEINNKKYIIEMDGGLGHGKNTISDISKEEAIYIDNQKDILAKKHDIEVIRIDCSYSGIGSRYEYIKNNVIASKLSNILDLSYVDFIQSDIKSCQSLLIEACNLWNNGSLVSKIAKELNLSSNTIIEYLKTGSKSGLCVGYSPKSVDCKKVINLNDNKIFDSIAEASRYYNINELLIGRCCRRRLTFGGWYNGEKQIWMYYEEYLKLTKEELDNYIPKENRGTKIVCLNTLQIFNQMKDAAKWCGLKSSTAIYNCCVKKHISAGKHPETGESLFWVYYKDYINMTEKEIKSYISRTNSHYRKVICLNTLDIFDQLKDAAKWCGLNKSTGISECCRNKQKTAGKHPETEESLRWMYYEDYIKLYGELNLEELAS